MRRVPLTVITAKDFIDGVERPQFKPRITDTDRHGGTESQYSVRAIRSRPSNSTRVRYGSEPPATLCSAKASESVVPGGRANERLCVPRQVRYGGVERIPSDCGSSIHHSGGVERGTAHSLHRSSTGAATIAPQCSVKYGGQSALGRVDRVRACERRSTCVPERSSARYAARPTGPPMRSTVPTTDWTTPGSTGID
jgi:hypothetical protein